MKVLGHFLLSGLIVIPFYCSSQPFGFRKENILLPDRLIVQEHIPFDTMFTHKLSSHPLDSTSRPIFEFTSEMDILWQLAEKAMNGKIKVYDVNSLDFMNPFDLIAQEKPMEVKNIRERLGEREETILVFEDDGEEKEVVYKQSIIPEEISSIEFIEEWAFTINPLQFSKKVVAGIPIRRYNASDIDDSDIQYKQVFYYYNPQPTDMEKSNLVLFANIKYEHLFDLDNPYTLENFSEKITKSLDDETYGLEYIRSTFGAPFFNSTNQTVFIRSLVKQATNNKSKVYDYLTSTPLSQKEVEKKIIIRDTVSIMNIDGESMDTVVQREIIDEIRSVIFIEEWYFNPETLRIEIQVKGIAPVRYYFINKGDNTFLLKREVLFVLSME